MRRSVFIFMCIGFLLIAAALVIGATTTVYENIAVTGITLDTDGALTANSDLVVPSQKAVKTYSDSTAQTQTNKTLTTPIIASFYQDAGKTKLMTTPNTASDTLAAIAATQALTNKTIDGSANTITNISLTTGITGTLPAANGGTGFASYTTGDIPYASGATAISKLEAVATNQIIKSAGTSTAPTYGDANAFAYGATAMYPTTTATLTAAEARVLIRKFTATTGTVAPSVSIPTTTGANIFMFHNSTGGTLTIKKTGGTGATLASTKHGFAFYNGSDYEVWAVD